MPAFSVCVERSAEHLADNGFYLPSGDNSLDGREWKCGSVVQTNSDDEAVPMSCLRYCGKFYCLAFCCSRLLWQACSDARAHK